MRIQCLFPLFFFFFIYHSIIPPPRFLFSNQQGYLILISFLPSFSSITPLVRLTPSYSFCLLPFHFHQCLFCLSFFFFFVAFRRVFFLAFSFFLRWQLQYCTSHFLPSVPSLAYRIAVHTVQCSTQFTDYDKVLSFSLSYLSRRAHDNVKRREINSTKPSPHFIHTYDTVIMMTATN